MSRRETRSTAPSRETRSAPSKSKTAAASKPPSVGSKRTSTNKPASKKGAAGSTKPASSQHDAAPEVTSMPYAERLRLMKTALKPQRPDLTAKELDVLARTMVAGASKGGNAEKERFDVIQANVANMMADEDVGEHTSDEILEDDVSLEDQSPQASKGKGKQQAKTTSPPPTRVSPKQRKRKARQDEEKAGSAESSPEQPKKKQKKTQATDDVSPAPVEVEESGSVRYKKKAQATKNVSPGPGDVEEGETTMHRKPVEKDNTVSKDEDRVASLLARNSNKPRRTRRVGRRVLESSDEEALGTDEQRSSDSEGPRVTESSSPDRRTKRPRKQKTNSPSVHSPVNIDDSGEDSSSFKPAADEKDNESEEDVGEVHGSDDGLIIKDVDQHSGRKGKKKVLPKTPPDAGRLMYESLCLAQMGHT
ncbi:uncharacterized protein B0H18DRAFT_1126740 [Fomitopsis serialis]|uniref:uncharacterized protein n=1 Tax=Fomitopsis serialis TaxID=139415 RepID=UPI00200790EE|nr:uncharacterized protein B0H18DRAFT_1126740 [Neoantrodia serialis]KAH9912830.1 hypothetical protein B0H18DRAFT_1126740 [Neoantrodia serialis]